MGPVYYKIPLQLEELLEGRELPTCSLRESIENNLGLIIMTRFGEHRYDSSFGCEVWDLDFEMIKSENTWKEVIRLSLQGSIIAHEKRLQDIELDVEINDIQKFHAIKNYTQVRKRVDIFLKAVMKKTGEPFPFRSSLLLSPLSLD